MLRYHRDSIPIINFSTRNLCTYNGLQTVWLVAWLVDVSFFSQCLIFWELGMPNSCYVDFRFAQPQHRNRTIGKGIEAEGTREIAID